MKKNFIHINQIQKNILLIIQLIPENLQNN